MSRLPAMQATSYLAQVGSRKFTKWSLKERVRRSLQYFTLHKYASRLQYYKNFLPLIKKQALIIEELDSFALQQKIQRLHIKLRSKQSPSTETIAYTMALIREVTGRKLGMYHFDCQLLGGLAMLYGNVIEMQTGEGKTLTAILPAACAALMGIPSYILSVNDYLTQRDAEQTRAVYEALGLSVGCITRSLNDEQKKQAYRCDIIYCTASELVFDYLKDQTLFSGKAHYLKAYSECLLQPSLVSKQRMIRGLHFAIIDEIDSVLLDEALTPLILSGNAVKDNVQESIYQEALTLGMSLVENEDFIIDLKNKRIELLAAGGHKIYNADLLAWGGLNRSSRGNTLVNKALFALYLLKKDYDYLVDDNKVKIVDGHTGRLMADRNWERGLHQLVELKENCPLTFPHETLAQITFQKFFQNFSHLAGMSGTVVEARKELGMIYQLPIVIIPTNKKCQRQNYGTYNFLNKKEKYQAIVEKSKLLSQAGRAVLIGTTSIYVSEELHRYFVQENILHQVLNAQQNKDEANIVSMAGQSGSITIATSMAGRGTDIKLSAECEIHGGLHVIVCEFDTSKRVDRQLVGRAARQGDAGSFEYLFTQDDLILQYTGEWGRYLLAFFRFKPFYHFYTKVVLIVARSTQFLLEKRNRAIRYQLLKSNTYQDILLSLGRKNF